VEIGWGEKEFSSSIISLPVVSRYVSAIYEGG